MINNFDLIIPFIKPSEGDFYYLQILQRKKDNPEIGSNSRVIKNYYIKSPEHLLHHKEEIIKLCEVFNARASIRLNRRSFEKVAFRAMVNTANVMANREYEFVKKVYDRACGEVHSDPIKKWIIDIDRPYDETIEKFIKSRVEMCEPFGSIKYLATIPSLSGFHIITTPFRVDKFLEHTQKEFDIHKDNPTNLYIP